ncbi:MAG: hypothetical protein ACRC0L_13250, partial [Angustibacter sp.]
VADAERTQRLARQRAEREREAAREAQRAAQGPSAVGRSVVAHARHLRLATAPPDCPWCAQAEAPDPARELDTPRAAEVDLPVSAGASSASPVCSRAVPQ